MNRIRAREARALTKTVSQHEEIRLACQIYSFAAILTDRALYLGHANAPYGRRARDQFVRVDFSIHQPQSKGMFRDVTYQDRASG